MAASAQPKTAVMALQRRSTAGGDLVELQVLAREAGLHPEVVRRFVQLGLLEQRRTRGGAPLFPRDAAARLATAARLRRDLGLGWSGAVLAYDLLARIEELERRLSHYEPRRDRMR